jgi:hypothetical protein
MALFIEVLGFLRPNGGYIARGEEYEGIEFIECEPFSKEEFEAGFAAYDAWKAEQDAEQAAKKAAAEAKLAALGLTTDDLKALGLGGN